MAVTMEDIAREVGVSQATVSYVLNGRADKTISAPVRCRILEVAERLSYRPNRLARAMVTARTGAMGAVVRELVGGWDAQLAEGIEAEGFQRGVSLLLGCSHHDPVKEQELLEQFLEYRVDGLVIEPPSLAPEPGRYQPLLEEGVQVVFVVLCPRGLQADLVAMDNVKAGYQVGQHLIERGWKRLAYVCHRTPAPDCAERYQGLAAAARAYGLPRPRLLRMSQEPDLSLMALGHDLVAAHLESAEPANGFFAFSDYLALGVMQALQERGIKIGEEVGVVSVDDVPETKQTDPPLSTVRQPMREIGAEAVRLLLRRTNGERDLPPQRILLEPTLVVRGSSGGL